MSRPGKSEVKAPDKENKRTHSGNQPSALELANAGNKGMLVATPIRVAMGAAHNNNNVPFGPGTLLRSATTLEQESFVRVEKKRNSDSVKRNSRGRPGSLVETLEMKRRSDPSSASSTLAHSVTSLKALFTGESQMFRKLGTSRVPKKAVSNTGASNVTPGFKTRPKDPGTSRFYRDTPNKSQSPSASSSSVTYKNASSSVTSKNAGTSVTSKKSKKSVTSRKGDISSTSNNKTDFLITPSSHMSRSRRKRSTRKRFFGTSSNCRSKDRNATSSEDEQVGHSRGLWRVRLLLKMRDVLWLDVGLRPVGKL